MISPSELLMQVDTDSPNLIVFDFDGTLTFKDSLLEFISFATSKPKLYLELLKLVPELLAMKLGMGNNEAVKTKLLRRVFRNKSKNELTTLGESFCNQYFDQLIRLKGLEAIRNYQAAGARIIIVTASVEEWVQPFAKRLGAELIATKLAYRNDQFTGELATPNCRGKEKTNRLKEYLSTEELPAYIAYGDTDGDAALYEFSAKYHHRFFHET